MLREQGEEIVEFVEYLRLVSVVGLRLVFVRLVLCTVYVFVVVVVAASRSVSVSSAMVWMMTSDERAEW